MEDECFDGFDHTREKYDELVIYTETIGVGNTMVMFCEKEVSRQGAFLMRYLENVKTKCPVKFSKEAFDVDLNCYRFLRESHENNKRKSMGFAANNGISYNQCGLFS